MAAMVVGPKCRRLIQSTISRSLIGSQTTTRRIRWGQSLTACAPVKRMSSSARMLRGSGPIKTLHFQILFERFEKQFDFPAVLVDGGDGGGPEVQEIGQQNDLPLVDWIPNHHAPHKVGTVLDRVRARKADEFI